MKKMSIKRPDCLLLRQHKMHEMSKAEKEANICKILTHSRGKSSFQYQSKNCAILNRISNTVAVILYLIYNVVVKC